MSIFPSENTWITPRTKDVKITTDNCMLILPKKISHIEQVYLNANSFALWNLKGSDGLTHNGISLSNLSVYQNMKSSLSVLDIGKYVVEKAKYDTLNTYTAIQSIPWGEIATNNAWFYSHNETDIQCINSRPKCRKSLVQILQKCRLWKTCICRYIKRNKHHLRLPHERAKLKISTV